MGGGKAGTRAVQPNETLLLRHCVPFGLTEFDPVGIRLGAGPEDSPAVVLGEICLHLTEQNKSSGAWSKKEKKRRTVSFKRRGRRGNKKGFLQNFSKISLWIPVLFILREISVHPTVLKLGYL